MSNAKETICEAFLKLLKEKTFEELSVKEIIQKAGFSRSTFYLHFVDKYELLEEVRRKVNGQFLSFYDKEFPHATKSVPHFLCEHIFTYRSFYEMEFRDASSIQKLSNKLAVHLLKAYHDQDYAIFASFGTIGYLSFWVKGGFELSPKEAGEKLLKIGMTNWTEVLDLMVATKNTVKET